MQHLTLVYRGTISVETNSNTQFSVASRFERGNIRPSRRRSFPEFGGNSGPLTIHDLEIDVDGGDVEGSETPVDAALTGFLDRHRQILDEVIETELRRTLPSNCHVAVELSFWRGSVAFAATVTLLLVGQHFASKEALNFLQVVLGPPISRCLRHVITEVGKTGPRASAPVAIILSLDPSSLAELERLKKRVYSRLDRFDRRTEGVARHVDREGKLIFAVSVLAIILALILGANYGASWYDALRALFKK